MPQVSVITPVRDGAAFLDGCLRSVASQTLRDYEHLVVDDGSSDGSAAIVETFSEADPRVRLIRMDVHGGPGAARNRALAEANGDFVALLDADDSWEPTVLSDLVAAVRDHPEAVGAAVDAVVEGSGTARLRPAFPGGGSRRDLLVEPQFYASALLVRRSAADGIVFDPTLPDAEDWDWCVRLSERGTFVHAGPGRLRHAARAGSRSSPENVESALRARDELLGRYGQNLREARLLRRARAAYHYRRGLLLWDSGRPGGRANLVRAALLHPGRLEYVGAAVATIGGRRLFAAARRLRAHPV